MTQWERTRRSAAVAFLGGKCVTCGSVNRLEFDHIDPATKIKAIGKLYHATDDRFWTEIRKCQLLCELCHRIKTGIERGYGTYRHGTIAMYVKGKCRCEKCIEIWRLYQDRYNANRRKARARVL